MKCGYVDIPEGQVHYRTAGSGEPVLLLHQTPFSSEEFAKVIPILARHYRVVAPDTMGYGNSDKPPRPFQLEDYVDTIAGLLDALGIEATNVVGHHTGAALASEMAVAYRERVRRVVLSGCSLYDPQERVEFQNSPRFKPFEIDKEGAFLSARWKSSWSLSPHMDLDMTYRLLVASLQAGPTLHDAHQAAFAFRKELKLPLIRCPVLVMAGSDDMFFPKMGPVSRLIPGSVTRVIQGAGNEPALEKPAEFAQAILEFFQSTQA